MMLLRWAAYGTQLHVYNDVSTTLNTSFQCCYWESLDNLSRWLCFDFYDLAEDFSLASLCCWLGANFQPSQTWDGEDTSLLHVCCRHLCQLVKQSSSLCLLQITSSSQCFCDGTLGHSLNFCLHCFHGLLHWCHAIEQS